MEVSVGSTTRLMGIPKIPYGEEKDGLNETQ